MAFPNRRQHALSLAEDEVHIWLAAVDLADPSVQTLEETLAADELARADRFRFKLTRGRFVAARGLLRTILARYLDTDPGRLSFRYGPYGKPALLDARGRDLRFNLSHADGMALYALARDREIGIDIERIRSHPMDARIATEWFSPEENAALRELPTRERLERFFRSWTQREAYLKARGEGLAASPMPFDAWLVRGDPMVLGSSEDIHQRAARWFVRELAPGPGYAAAVAGEGQRARLTFAHWRA